MDSQDIINTENKKIIDKAFTELYSNNVFNFIAKKIGKDQAEDLKSTVMLILMDIPEEKLLTIIEGGYLTQYGNQTLRFQVSDKNWTHFRKLYGNRENLVLNDGMNDESNDFSDDSGDSTSGSNPIDTMALEEFEKYAERLDREILGLNIIDADIKLGIVSEKMNDDMKSQTNDYFYHARLLNEMLEKQLNQKQLAKLIGIPYSSVRHTIKQYREHLTKYLQDKIK